MKKLFVLITAFFCCFLYGQEKSLLLRQKNILVINEDSSSLVQDGKGVHLYVQKQDGIKSIRLMVVSSNYNDPGLSTIRAKKTNSLTKKEKFYYNGKIAKGTTSFFPHAIITSSTENHPVLGECFHAYLPAEMYYGYVIQNQNEVSFEDGMAINIRTYSKKGCDPTGKWQDNFLNLYVTEIEKEEAYASIAEAGDGELFHVLKKEELTQKLIEEVETLDKKDSIDLVFAIDATASMKDDFSELKVRWLPVLKKQLSSFDDIRVGLLFYKDYGSDYNFKGLPVKSFDLNKNYGLVIQNIKNVSPSGGSDEEEAVYEALYGCTELFSWRGDSTKKLVFIGDASPHSKPQKNFVVKPAQIFNELKNQNIKTDVFLILDNAEKAPASFTPIKKTESSPKLKNAVEELNNNAK